MMKDIFERIEHYYGSQKASAANLHIAYSTYCEWRKKGDGLPEKTKMFLKMIVADLPLRDSGT